MAVVGDAKLIRRTWIGIKACHIEEGSLEEVLIDDYISFHT